MILCDIRSCKPFSIVIYEKTDIILPTIWTPVYDSMKSSYLHSLAIGSDYTLYDRAEHSTLETHFLLKLRDVTVKDNGRWRCVVVDKNNARHASIAVPLTVVPENDVTIIPAKPELVAGQSETFTCDINGIYPEPIFEWILNGTKHPGNTTRKGQRDDGLWYAANTVVQLEFDEAGKVVLICALTSQNRDPLVDMNITVDVKAPAEITYPKEDLLITTDGSAPVVMRCNGLGYNPRITWKHNGSDIGSDNQRYISTDCDTSSCTGTLTLAPVNRPLTCENVLDYPGNYTCIVTLKPPHKSERTSHPIRVKILHKPLLKEQPETVYIGESKAATLRCEVCSTTSVTSVWTFGGEILQGHNVEHQEDGSVTLTGYHPSGEYNRTVYNTFGSLSCIIHVVNTDHVTDSSLYLTITYSVLSAVGFMLVMCVLWQAGKRLKTIPQRFCGSGRHPSVNGEYEMIPTVLDMQFPSSLETTQTIKMTGKTWSIWRSSQPDCVFVGGHNIPSLTVINDSFVPTRHFLPKGTSIVHGLFINTTIHVINVYDAQLKTHSIYCVNIDIISKDGQLNINSTLKLSKKIKEPRCIFAVDTSSIGVYCASKRFIDMFNIKDITKPSHVGTIQLTGYDANKNDSLCVNSNGHICVLSYKYRSVYIHSRRGEFMHTFHTGMWYDPVYIQCFRENSLAVVNLYGEIHRFEEGRESTIITLGENTYVQAAVFTGSMLWVIDALDSTDIHVCKTGDE